jgi:hypothetical protein
MVTDLHIETIISGIASYVKQTIFELSMLIRKEWVLFLGKIKEIENWFVWAAKGKEKRLNYIVTRALLAGLDFFFHRIVASIHGQEKSIKCPALGFCSIEYDDQVMSTNSLLWVLFKISESKWKTLAPKTFVLFVPWKK